MNNRFRKTAVWLALAFFLAATPVALASTFDGKDEYVVSAGSTVDGNLYAFGQTVRIDGTVNGDLISAGKTIEISRSGHVTGDVMAAGQSVRVYGTVDGDVRGAGYLVQIGDGTEAATVGGELLGAGYSVGLAENSRVGDDFTATAYQGLLDGDVGHNVHFGGAGLDLNGHVAGSVQASVGGAKDASTVSPAMFGDVPSPPRTILPGLHTGSAAKVGGDLTYVAPVDAAVPAASVAGTVKFTEAVDREAGEEAAKAPRSPLAGLLGDALKHFLALLVIGVLFLWLGPRLAAASGEVLDNRPLQGAGWGLLTIVGVIVGILALCVATIFALIIVGILHIGTLVMPVLSLAIVLFSLLTFGFFGLVFWMARVVTALWLGRWLLARFAPNWAANNWVVLAIGALIYTMLTNIPVVAGLLSLIGLLLGLGALHLAGHAIWRHKPVAGPYTPPLEPTPPAAPEAPAA